MEPEIVTPDEDIASTQTLSEFAESTGASESQAVAEPSADAPKPRHRSANQKARPADVPRIANLTKRLRETEAERDALKAAQTTPAAAPTVETPKVEPPARVQALASVVAPVTSATDDPEPDPAKYEDLTKYFKDQSLWAARETRRIEKAEDAKIAQASTQEKETARLTKQWIDSTAAATAKWPDFAAVAYGDSPIPKGSVVDLFVREAKSGAFVLYHLKKNPQDLTAVLGCDSKLDQLEYLTLLGQRLTISTRTPAVTTGAAAAPPEIKPVPRPPTPVRTGPMRTDEEALPDPEHVSLSGFAEAYGDHRRRG